MANSPRNGLALLIVLPLLNLCPPVDDPTACLWHPNLVVLLSEAYTRHQSQLHVTQTHSNTHLTPPLVHHTTYTLSTSLRPRGLFNDSGSCPHLSSWWLCISGSSLQTALPLPIETWPNVSAYADAQPGPRATSFRSDHLDYIFLQVLWEHLNLIPINLPTPQPRHVLTPYQGSHIPSLLSRETPTGVSCQ